jgi:periplasmic divalent cation tolerance protein
MPELIEIQTTTAEKTDVQMLATLLLEKRLAACTHISGPIESNYWWNGRLETTREWQLTMKTSADKFAAIEALFAEHHPYDEPELLALPILAASEGYRRWLLNQLMNEAADNNEATTADS